MLGRRAARASLLASASLLAVALGSARADVYNVGGGTITTSQSDSSADSTGTGGGFALRPNTTGNNDTVVISGVSITNTSGAPSDRAIDLGYLLTSTGSYAVTMEGSTLSGQGGISGGHGILAHTTNGLLSLDTTGGAANTISGTYGVSLFQGSGTGSVSANLGADVITSSHGEALNLVVHSGNVAIDMAGTTLDAAGVTSSARGILATSAFGTVTLGALNGGLSGSITATNGVGIQSASGTSGFVQITLASTGSINAATGILLTGYGLDVVDSYGTIIGTSAAISATGSLPNNYLTVILRDGSLTSGSITGRPTDDVFVVYDGADITNASFAGAGGRDTLVLRGTGNATLDLAAFAGIEAFQKDEAGSWVLTNGGLGDLTVNAGTLQLDSGTSFGASSALTVNGGTFDLNDNLQTLGALSGAGGTIDLGSGTLTTNSTANTAFAGVIEGAGGLVKMGTGSLTLSGANTYSGGTIIAGGTLSLGSSTAAGTGAIITTGSVIDYADGIDVANTINLNSNTTQLQVLAGATATQSGDILEASGPRPLEKIGGGTLILAGTNGYTGATTVSAGTLRGGGTFVFNAASDFTIASGATLDLGGFLQEVGSLAGAGTVTNSGGSDATLYVGAFGLNTSQTVFSGVIQDGATNATALEVEAAVKLTLTGANTYTGGTVICDCATLQIGNGGTTGSIIGDITAHNGTLIFNRSSDYAFTGDILQGFGTPGAVIQNGSGVLTLSGNNDYAGDTTINAGTILVTDDFNLGVGNLVLNGGTLKTDSPAFQLDPAKLVTLNAGGGTLDVDNMAAMLMENVVGGAGALTIRGTDGLVALLGANTYGGDTTVTGGATLLVEQDVNLGDSNSGLTLDNGTLLFFDDFTLGANRTVTLGAAGGTVAVSFAGEIAGTITGSGSLTVSAEPFGGGDLYLTGINDYTGGTVLLGDACCGIPAIVVITDDRNLGHADGDISIDTGGIIFDADMTLNAGRAVTVLGDGALFDVDDNTVTIAGAIGGSGPMGKDGDGLLILTGDGTLTGDVDIVDGMLQLGNGGTTGSLATSVVTSSGTLAFNRSNTLVFAADISDACGCFGAIVTQMGSGTTILTGANTYTGGTNITAGTLQIGNGGTAGSIIGDVVNDGALVFKRSDDISFAGVVSGGGTLTQAGSGILTIDGVNIYSGNTIVTAGVLKLGTGASLGTGGLVIDGGRFDLNGGSITLTTLSGTGGTLDLGSGTVTVNASGTLAADITGSGSLVKAGTGTLVLSGNNDFSGGITIAGGTVSFAHSNSTGTGTITTTGSVIDYANGITLNNPIVINSNTTQLQALAGVSATQAGVISQTGGARPLQKIGAGTIILAAVNTYTGATTVSGGRLVVDGSINSPVTVASGAQLGGDGSVGATTIQSGGTISAGNDDIGTLTVNGNLTLQAGSTLAAEVSPGSADRLTVNGSASLGGSLFANFQTGVTYTPATYTLISTTGTVSGTFASFNTPGIPTGYRANIIYGASSVLLDLGYADFLWKAAPGSGDWHTASNWQNGLVPVAGTTAEFASSSITDVSIQANASAGTIQLDSSAPHYDFRIGFGGTLSLSGGVVQLNSVSSSFITSDGGTLAFTGTGNAARSFLTANFGGTISFAGTADAGAAARVSADSGGVVDFSATTGAAGDNQVSAGSIAGQNGSSIKLGANTLTTGALNSSTQFAGVISGTGGLVKTGTGTLILSGENTYTGVTTINAGTLQFNFGASVPGDITNNATLVFNLSNVHTYGSVISGAGAVRIAGGDLTFTGANSYTGGTTIDSDENLRIGNGGTTGSIAGDVVNNGLLIFNRSDNVTFAGIVSGGGTLFQNGQGILTLTGANTYTGVTRIAQGTLQIGNGGTVGSVAGDVNITGGSALIFNRSDTVTFAGVISGNTGRVTKAGANTVILTGASTHGGGTTIAAGMLQLGNGGTTGSIAGNIVNNGILAFNRSNDLLIAGSISGSGSVQQNGSGITTLTGASTYTGATTISAGTLVVNGSITSNVTLTAGALKGTGQIGSLTANSGSTVAPGNSIGTLNAASVTFAAGSIYEAEVNDAGQADLIQASGSASLNGTLQVLAAAGNYAPVTNYRILNAAGGVSGAFAGVTSNQADLTPSLIYSANAVDLRLVRNNIQFGAAYGTTPNQIAAGGGVSAGGAGSALYLTVANGYAASTIGATLDGLSGEIYAGQRSAAFEDSRMIRNTVLARLASNPEGTGGWAAGFADDGTLDSDGNAGEAHRQNTGFIAGIDFLVGEGLRLGLGGAYAENKLSIASRASTAHGVLGSLLAYVSYRSEGFSLQMGGSYGWGESGAVRTLSVPAETAGADRKVETGSIFAQAAYDFGLPVIPYVGLSHVSLNHGAFTESGGIAALSGSAASDAETYAMLGFRAPVGSFAIQGMTLTPRIDIGWNHAFDAAAPAQNLAFATGAGFTVLGAPLGSDAAALQLGFDLTIVPGANLSVGYDGSFSGRGQSHGVRGGLNWRF